MTHHKTPAPDFEKLEQAINNIEVAYSDSLSDYHNYNDWEKDQWDRVNNALADAKAVAAHALRQAYQTGLDARDAEKPKAGDASAGGVQWAHSGPCQPQCTCTFARAASLGGSYG